MGKAKKSKLRQSYIKLSSSIRSKAKRLQDQYGKWLKAPNDALAMFKPVRELGANVSDKDLRRAIKQMKEVRKDLRIPTIEKKLNETIDRLNARKYTDINRSNISEFLNFMEDTYYKGLAKIYGSPEVAMEINRVMGRKKMDPLELMRNLEDWSENVEKAIEKRKKSGKEVKLKKLNLTKKYYQPRKRKSSNKDYE